MRDLFIKFRKDESGASLVEYAVALIVVTIIGGAGVVMLVIFLLRPLICGGPIVHHPEEPARDDLLR